MITSLTLIHPSYDDTETVASKFLPFVANYYGIDLPPMFPDTDPTQYVDGDNIEDDYSKSLHALNYIQTEIWRRILINLNEIIVSKGTDSIVLRHLYELLESIQII